MELKPFTIKSKCVATDEELYANIRSALARKLPVIPQYLEHNGLAVVVGSGPSVIEQIETIREYRQSVGTYLVALKDAHDWLLDHGIIPHCAVAIDPQASRARVFKTPHVDVLYAIASQCHPAMFEHLAGFHVELWHLYVREWQAVPEFGTPLIAGGTTTGLRAITLLYTMGFRRFELFGFDSCVKDGLLRFNGDLPRPGDDALHDIWVDGRKFMANPSMVAQAKEFQNLFWTMPDIEIHSNGEGLITAILEARKKMPVRRISFIHRGGPSMASYRYRAAMPAEALGATLNDLEAEVLILGKPENASTFEIKQWLGLGKKVIIDFCDAHFDRPLYRDLVRLADEVVCSTMEMAKLIKELGREANVIPEPYELPEVEPHCVGNHLLWFGHPNNLASLNRILPTQASLGFAGGPLHVVTIKSAIQASLGIEVIEWSPETIVEELSWADIVLMPATAKTKSCNRTVEAIRQGCFVVAEPHPSIEHIPGIWIGDIQEGIAWATQHPGEANARTREAQTYISRVYDPKTVACAWSRVIQGSPSNLEVGVAPGQAGSTPTWDEVPPISVAM